MKNLGQDRRCPSRVSNRVPPECKSPTSRLYQPPRRDNVFKHTVPKYTRGNEVTHAHCTLSIPDECQDGAQ
jgi:hypothetical protein